MGEFDDVLAMEPGDEWDDHVIGGPPDADEIHGPVRSVLRLPNALLELRGEPPDDVIDTLDDLTDERLELLGEVPTLTLSLRRDGESWVLGGDGGTTAVPDAGDDLLRSVVARLDRLAVETDPLRLHLDVAAVRRGEHGIVLVDARPAALDGQVVHVGSSSAVGVGPSSRDDRALVVADLLELGADFVTADLVTLLPGSRTVFGHPSPPYLEIIVARGNARITACILSASADRNGVSGYIGGPLRSRAGRRTCRSCAAPRAGP